MVQMLLLLILCLVAIPSNPGHLPPRDDHSPPPPPPRHPRATYSRPTPSDASGEKLYGYDCLARPDKTQVFSMGNLAGKRCKNPTSPDPVHFEHKIFDVFQYQRVEEVTLLSCGLEISRFQGTCGMFDHFAWDAPPHISVPQPLTIRECLQLHEERILHWGDQRYPLKMGENSISAVETGSLRYDAKSATVVCTGSEAHLERDGDRAVEAALTMEHLKLVLRREKGQKLLSGAKTLVITSGEHHGVQWSRQEVEKGGVQLDSVTFVLDFSTHHQSPKCPLALLRQQVKMTRASRGSPPSLLRTPASVNLSDPSLQVTAVVWTNSKLAVHQLEPISLPAACGTGTFYRTNHNNILLSPDTSPQALQTIKNNALNYLTLSNLAEASRQDLIHFHVESLFSNLTQQIEALQCMGTLQQMYQKDAADDEEIKVRYVEAGEVVFRLLCPRVELLPGRHPAAEGGPVCTKQLPVHTPSSSTAQIMYLEPVSRYLMTSSRVIPCSVHQLAPTVYETLSGNFVYHNGTTVVYLKAEVREHLNLQRKFSKIELYNINQDADLSGLESQQQLEQSSLFLEYNRFLEVDNREALSGGPSVPHARANGGQAAHSWWVTSHARAADLSQEALAAVGFSWFTKLWRSLQESIATLRPLATVGGSIYFARLVISLLSKVFRFLLLLYTRPGESFRNALRLSINSSSRREEAWGEEMSKMIDEKVTTTIGTEMAVVRAKFRQDQ